MLFPFVFIFSGSVCWIASTKKFCYYQRPIVTLTFEARSLGWMRKIYYLLRWTLSPQSATVLFFFFVASGYSNAFDGLFQIITISARRHKWVKTITKVKKYVQESTTPEPTNMGIDVQLLQTPRSTSDEDVKGLVKLWYLDPIRCVMASVKRTFISHTYAYCVFFMMGALSV